MRSAQCVAIGAVTLAAQSKPAGQRPERQRRERQALHRHLQRRHPIYDEATEKLEDRIVLKTGLPRSLLPSQDRTRFYVLDSTYEKLEVVDIATRKTLNTFTLSSGNKHTRVISMQADPLNRYLVLLTRTATKLVDRWEIGPPTLQQFDLASGQVTRTIPWPRGEERENVNLRFSPDGKFLYFFGDEVVIVDTEKFEEVETWPFTPAVGRRPGPHQPRSGARFLRPAGHVHRPVHDAGPGPEAPHHGHRQGGPDARAEIDFRPIGPAEQVSFAQAPDRKRAYGIKSDIGRYEFWTFDLEKATVVSRQEFKGRPRMSPRVSSNGRIIYVYVAGETIDLYEAATYKYLRTIHMGADQTTELFVVPGGAPPRPAHAEGRVTPGPAADTDLRRAFAYLAPYWRRLVLVMAISLVSTGLVARHAVSQQGSRRSRADRPRPGRAAAHRPAVRGARRASAIC